MTAEEAADRAPAESSESDFAAFTSRVLPRLRAALVAELGAADGADASSEALIYAWHHWERLRTMKSPQAYLYRVGLSRVRKRRRRFLLILPAELDASSGSAPLAERHHELEHALATLTKRQRVAVVLHVAFGWTLAEVGDHLGIAGSTVQNHVDRALLKLQVHLTDQPSERPTA